jgi:effector-binding domain-containing protein
MIDTPQIVTTEPLHFAKIYARIPTSSIQREMGKLLGELSQSIQAQNIKVTGSWFTHHLHAPAEFFDFDVCMPVASAVKPSGRVEPGVWPAMKIVRTVYHGGYEGLPSAWGEFKSWIHTNHLSIAEDIWERYLINPNTESDAARWQTELIRQITD